VKAPLSLILAVLVLAGGAVALWWSDRGQSSAPTPPPVAIEQARTDTEPLPPPQAYVIAISWHAAFCETKPNLTECREQDEGDYTADHFALHGLWPQDDEYCDVSERLIALDRANRWDDLPEVEISDSTWRELVRLMPGSREQLERHEWLLHGTCAGVSAETYFKRAIAFTEAVNRSGVRDLFADNMGKRIRSEQIRDAMDAAFGAGAGRKVRIDCEEDGNRDLVYELRINLDGDVMGREELADFVHAGRNISVGCPGGVVDRVGLQ